ncbi:DUF2096 family protein [Candidatus Bathyarchaeota archaeon]|nr:DUF2096 family protein [Candidatus Bathyarchaeota archaeon]
MCIKLDYYALWKLMADLIIDLKRANVKIPPQVMTELRSLKTLIEISRMEGSGSNVIRRIEECLSNLESYLTPVAQEKLGDKYIKEFMRRISEARRSEAKVKLEKRFLAGVPRDKHWIRVKLTEDTPLDLLKRICSDLKLDHKVQEGDFLLIYGDDEAQIKKFVKRMQEALAR